MRPFTWLFHKPLAPFKTTPSFRPALESLGDRLAPHAGPWTSSGLGMIGVSPSTEQITTHFAVVTQSSAYAGGESRILVIALDENNRPVRDFTGTVHFTSSDESATLPADYTFTAEDRGRKLFSVTLSTEGSQTITVSDSETSSITGEGKVNVLAAPVATHFYVQIERSSYAGAETRVAVIALDANNRPVPTYTGTVSLSSSDAEATLPAEYTFTAADHGVHIFTITPSEAGELTITATDTTTSSVIGTATTTVLEAQTVAKIVTFTKPATKAGATVTVFVVALDANNRPVTNFTGTVALTSSDAAATLPAEYTFTASDRGIKAFSLTLATVGSQTITATDTSDSTLIGTSTVNVVDATTLPRWNHFLGGRSKVDGWNR